MSLNSRACRDGLNFVYVLFVAINLFRV